MDEVKAFAAPLKIEGDGIVEAEVIVAQDDGEFAIDRPEFVEHGFATNIAQVPDLVDVLEQFRDTRHEFIMGIGDHPDGVILSCGHNGIPNERDRRLQLKLD